MKKHPFGFACRSLPLYSSARRQYAYLIYKARMQRIGDLSEADRHGIQQEIDRGKVLIEHGTNPSGRAAFFVGKLYGLLRDEERERKYISLANEMGGKHDG